MVLVQSSFHTTWAILFEMELEPKSLDWNGNKLEHKLELEDMKRTNFYIKRQSFFCICKFIPFAISSCTTIEEITLDRNLDRANKVLNMNQL